MKTLHTTVIIIITLAISVTTPAYSQENTNTNIATGKRSISMGIGFPDFSESFQGKIGLGVGSFPEYEGSDHHVATVMPLIDIRKPGAYFIKGTSINNNDGLASAGLTIFHISYWENSSARLKFILGPLLRGYSGRDESDSDELNGLGNIDQSAGVGYFMEFSAGSWLANVTVSPQDVGNDKEGNLTTFDIEYTTSNTNGLKLSTGLVSSWADDDYMQGYFGVTDAQSTQSGLSRFDSKAGLKDVGLQLKASYTLSPRWSLDGQIGYWRLQNDAANSPIVKDAGSVDQIRGLVGLSFQF